MTDEQLLSLYSDRSEQAVSETQRKYGAYCRTVAARMLADVRDVEECLSDCWLLVWNAIPPTRPEHFKGWLGAVVRNRALAISKANGRRVSTVDEAAMELADSLFGCDQPHTLAEAGDLGRAISAFLLTQKREDRVVFVRRYWYADSVEQAAARMGWTVSKTKSRLMRLRNGLWDHLSEEGFVGER